MKRMWSKNELIRMNQGVVRQMVEGGTLDNAKPIYCHPIHMFYNADGRMFKFTCLIFNNSNEQFTLSTFKTWFDELVTLTNSRARLMASGGTNQIKAAGEVAATTKLMIISSIDKSTAGNYVIAGVDADGGSNGFSDSDFSKVFPASTEFIDGVNKIN